MDFGEKIKRLRLNQGMTLEEVGQQVGVGKSTVRKWESGEIANMRRDKIAVLANALHVSPAYLMGWEDSPEKESPALPAGLLPIQRRKIPLLGSVAAGEPILADREYDAYISVDGDHRADAALRVDGDSMIPRYLDGDIVLIRLQDDVDDGQIAAVCIDDTVTLKHVYHLPDGVQLISENPKYRPMIFDSGNSNTIRILGLAIGFIRWEV